MIEDPVAAWARCRSWVEAALHDVRTHAIEDIEAGIASGAYQFWPGAKSAAITEIHSFPRARYLHIFLAGGDMEELIAMIPSWKSLAAHLGCSDLTLYGRPGWERALKSHGWQKRVVVVSTGVEEPSN
jgi:hypothetical protein